MARGRGFSRIGGGYSCCNGVCWIGSCRMGLGRGWIGALACGLMLIAVSAQGAQDKKEDDKKKDEKVAVKGSAAADAELPGDSNTEGSVTVGGQAIAYKAVAGTLTVGSTDPQDA